MTSSISVRSALALVLTAAPLAVAGCRSVQGSGLRGDGFPGAPPVLAAPPVRAESTLDNGVRVVVEENHLAPLVAIEVWVAAGASSVGIAVGVSVAIWVAVGVEVAVGMGVSVGVNDG